MITSQHAKTGTLITFAQYAFVTLAGLRRQLVYSNTSVSSAFCLIKSRIEGFEEPDHPQGFRFVLLSPSSCLAHEFVEELQVYLTRRHTNLICTIAHENWHQHSGVITNVSSLEDNHKSTETDAIQCSIDGINEAGEPTGWKRSGIQVTHHETTIHSQANSEGVQLPGLVIHIHRRNQIIVYSSGDSPRLLLLKPDAGSRFSRFHKLRFKPTSVPLARYILQVIIFLCINLLNNIAFAYHVPMTVHIIFRSGGLVVNLILGSLINHRR